MAAPILTHYFDFSATLALPENSPQILRGEPVPDDSYYFRTTRFDVPDGHYPELTRKVFTGVGFRRPNEIGLRVYAVD